MSDGSLEDAEGEVLKSWIIKEVAAFSDDKQKIKHCSTNPLKRV